MKKKLEKLKAKDNSGKTADPNNGNTNTNPQNKPAMTAVPNIYDNSSLFNRDTVE